MQVKSKGRAGDIVWLRGPHQSHFVLGVAVRFAADSAHVAILRRGRALAWLPYELAMSADELQPWLRGGRPKARPGTDGRLS